MSYEGYTQHICEKGHRFDTPCEYDFLEQGSVCHCGAKTAWHNDVDETNCESYGIVLEQDFQPLRISDALYKTCDLGHAHMIREAIYRLPKTGELKRHYKTTSGHFVLIQV